MPKQSEPSFVPVRAGVDVLAHGNGEPKRYANWSGAKRAAEKLRARGFNVEPFRLSLFSAASYVKKVG